MLSVCPTPPGISILTSTSPEATRRRETSLPTSTYLQSLEEFPACHPFPRVPVMTSHNWDGGGGVWGRGVWGRGVWGVCGEDDTCPQ